MRRPLGACGAFAVCLFIATTHSILIEVQHEAYDASFICCPETYLFDTDLMRCVCPPSRPYEDVTGRCIPCDTPARWNPLSKTCVRCQNGEINNVTG